MTLSAIIAIGTIAVLTNAVWQLSTTAFNSFFLNGGSMFNNLNMELVKSSVASQVVEFAKDHEITIEDSLWFFIDMEILSPY